MKRLDLFAIRCFEAAARLGSLTAAARTLGVSQPAVSVQIASLERNLAIDLLRRGARGVAPTAAGESLLPRIRRILAELDGLAGEAESGPVEGTLRIGSTDVVVLHRLPPVLRAFRRLHPRVELRIVVDSSLPLAHAVRSREIELALVTLPIPDPPGAVLPLYRDRLRLVVGRGHPLAGRKRVTLTAVAEGSLLAPKAESVSRGEIEGFFNARGLVPRIAMEISSPEVIRGMAREGLGIAVLPEPAVAEDLRRGSLVALAVAGWNLDRVSGLLLPASGPSSRAGREFLSLLEKEVGTRRALESASATPAGRGRPSGFRR